MTRALVVCAGGPLRGPLIDLFGADHTIVATLGIDDDAVAAAGASADATILVVDTTSDDGANGTDTVGAIVEATAGAFAARGHGRIVVIGRSTSFVGLEDRHAAARGAALLGLVRSTAVQVATHGVTVNLVLAGPFDEFTGRVAERSALGRPIHHAEVAAAVGFLCGPDAGFCTGSVVPVDGGLSIGFA